MSSFGKSRTKKKMKRETAKKKRAKKKRRGLLRRKPPPIDAGRRISAEFYNYGRMCATPFEGLITDSLQDNLLLRVCVGRRSSPNSSQTGRKPCTSPSGRRTS